MVNTPSDLLNAENLHQHLTQLALQHNIKTWCLAYSGGVDSQVLLHLLHLTKLPVCAVYIDHGLQTQSKDWAKHCQLHCESLNIPFQVIPVDARIKKAEGPEAAARRARYAALKTCIDDNACLLTAQHQDDQAETIMLQLLRGAGAAGLSGMPEIARFDKGWHARPLLNVSQKNILKYAKKNQLSWVEDPSNQQENYDRNYLRHSVMPVLAERWPALNKTMSVFSRQQAENSNLLDELAALDLVVCQIENDGLNITQLNKLNDARLRNVLRFWLKKNKASIPPRAVLAQIVQQIKNESHDNSLLISWAKTEVRRFRDKLFCLKKTNHDATKILNWNACSDLYIESIEKKLVFKKIRAEENKPVLNESILKEKISVRFRQGGEKIKPAGRSGTHDLKSLFQEADVPAWQRDRVPLLYVNDELVAVVGVCLADDFVVEGEGLLVVLV